MPTEMCLNCSRRLRWQEVIGENAMKVENRAPVGADFIRRIHETRNSIASLGSLQKTDKSYAKRKCTLKIKGLHESVKCYDLARSAIL